MRTGKKMLLILMVLCFMCIASVPMVTAKEPYRIGWCGPLSGPAAYMGDVGKKTVMMMAEKINMAGGINGHPVEIIAYDSENKPETTVQVVNRLIKKDGVVAIVGPTTSIEAVSALTIAGQTKTVMVMPALTSRIVTPVRKYVFKTVISEDDSVVKDFEYLKSRGLTKIAVITSQDGYGDAGLESIEALAPRMGVEIILKEKVSGTDNDMTPVLTKVKNSGAQALLDWCHLRPAILITRNIKQIGLSIPVIRSIGCVQESFLKDVQDNAEGHLGATFKFMDAESLPDNDPQKFVILRYQRDFQEKYKEMPIMFGADAYDAMQIVVMALGKVGADKEKLRDAIEQTRNHVGAGGIFNFSPEKHHPDGENAVIIYRVTNGKWMIAR
jgi:branched-chain amino acid transport system substrate-binding protein